MDTIKGLPADTVEASGECQVGFHDSCSGYTGPVRDPDLCACGCHDEWEL